MKKQIKLSTIARKIQRHVDEIKQHRAQCIHPDAINELDRYMARWVKRWSNMYTVSGRFGLVDALHRFYITAPSAKAARAYIEKSYPNFKVEGVGCVGTREPLICKCNEPADNAYPNGTIFCENCGLNTWAE